MHVFGGVTLFRWSLVHAYVAYFANMPPSMYSFVRYNQKDSFHCEMLIDGLVFACKQAEKCFLLVIVVVGLLQQQQI